MSRAHWLDTLTYHAMFRRLGAVYAKQVYGTLTSDHGRAAICSGKRLASGKGTPLL